MWPERGEALSRTIEAEAAISDLYAETLRRWAPEARAAVLPALTAAAALPRTLTPSHRPKACGTSTPKPSS